MLFYVKREKESEQCMLFCHPYHITTALRLSVCTVPRTHRFPAELHYTGKHFTGSLERQA